MEKGVMLMPALYKTTAKMSYTYTNTTATQFGLTREIIAGIADCFDPDFSIVDLALDHNGHAITATYSLFGYAYCGSLEEANALMYDTIRDYSFSQMRILETTTVPIASLADIDPEWRDAIPFSEELGDDGYPIESVCAELV